MKSLKLVPGILGCILLLSVEDGSAQCNVYTNAVPGITLQCVAGTGYRSGVAYNPIKNLYYSTSSGSGSYPIETFSDLGGASLSSTTTGGDYRGVWWNPNTNALEGNAFGTGGIMEQNLDATTGYALTGVTNLLGANQPTVQSVGAYDYDNDEILYYDNGTIYRKDRATNSNITSFTVTGLPVTTNDLNGNVILYIGCTGREYGLFDKANRRLLYINKTTEAYVDYTQLPATAPIPPTFPNSQRMDYTNDLLWLFDATSLVWHSYEVLLGCPAPNITLSNLSDVNCYGDSTGTVNAAASGGTGPYIYAWSTGDSLSSLNMLPAGTHTLTVIDAINCASDTTITVLQGDSILAIGATTAADCFGSATGTGTVTATGGTGNLTYAWSNGSTGSQQNSLTGGTYTVSITDSLGCLHLHHVTVNQPDSLAVWIDEVVDATCEGGTNGSITTSSTGGVIPYAYQWNDPANQIFSTAAGLSPGIYAVTVTDANNCTATEQQAVSFINPAPSATVSTQYNSNFSASLTATAGFQSYQWSNGAATSIISVSQSGNYVVTVTDALGCTTTASASVTLWASGIDEEPNALQVNAFPNPTSGILYLEYAAGNQEPLEAELVDALGKTIRSDRLTGTKMRLDYTTVASGQYLLRVSTENALATFRLVLE